MILICFNHPDVLYNLYYVLDTYTKNKKTMKNYEWIESVTTTTPPSTTTMRTTKTTSSSHPTARNSSDETEAAKSMKTIEHHSANIYDSDRDIIRKHNKHSE